MSNIREYLALKKKLNNMIKDLRRLGIYMVLDSNSIVNYTLIWEDHKNIVKQVNGLDFFNELTNEQNLALSLAVIQEQQNEYISENDIKIVNDFFETKITFKMVQELSTRFI